MAVGILTRAPQAGREETTQSRGRRPLLSRFGLAHGLMVLAGLLTFVLVAATLAERGERIAVAVAGTDLPAGAEVSAGRIRWVELPASSALAGSLVGTAELRSERWVAARALAGGEPLRPSDLVPAERWQSRRTMGLAVGRAAAAGGTLVVGDRVDVVSTAGGRARFVAGGLEVVGPPGGGERGFLAEPGREATVVVAVEPAEALALVQAVAAGPIQLIRATGAATLPVEPAGTVPGGGTAG